MTGLPAPGTLLFIALMFTGFWLGLALSALIDPAIWVRRPSGLGWSLDFANPHAWYVVAFSATWTLLLLVGLSHPEAPGVSTLLHVLAQV